MPRRRPHAAQLALAAAFAAALSCSGDPLESLRAHTYPPTFTYVPREKLDDTMWQLAGHIETLETLMVEQRQGGEALQAEVLAQLDAMQGAAAALGPGGWPTNHPRLTRNLERFRETLAAARRDAALVPPNYFLAGQVSGACTSCHASRD